MHLSGYPEVDAALTDEALVAAMASVRAVVRLGHQARNDAGVKLRQPLAEVIVATDDAAPARPRRPPRRSDRRPSWG